MTLWNFLVMMGVLGFAPLTLDGLVYNMSDSAGSGIEVTVPDPKADPSTTEKKTPAEIASDARVLAKLRHCTYLYHVFVFLQLFN